MTEVGRQRKREGRDTQNDGGPKLIVRERHDQRDEQYDRCESQLGWDENFRACHLLNHSCRLSARLKTTARREPQPRCLYPGRHQDEPQSHLTEIATTERYLHALETRKTTTSLTASQPSSTGAHGLADPWRSAPHRWLFGERVHVLERCSGVTEDLLRPANVGERLPSVLPVMYSRSDGSPSMALAQTSSVANGGTHQIAHGQRPTLAQLPLQLHHHSDHVSGVPAVDDRGDFVFRAKRPGGLPALDAVPEQVQQVGLDREVDEVIQLAHDGSIRCASTLA
jgi:hypothetical protein